MKITHINNKAIAAVCMLRGLEGSDSDILGAYRLLQKRYGLNQRPLPPSRVEAIRGVMVSDHFSYLMKIVRDEKKGR